jgi:hypothetical protein
MLSTEGILKSKIAFYEKDIDKPYTLNNFNGTFAIQSHAGIAEPLRGFLQRHFGVMRLERVKIDLINEALNELWDGPGSLEKILLLEHQYMLEGKEVKIMPSDIVKKQASEDDDTVVFDSSSPGLFDLNG